MRIWIFAVITALFSTMTTASALPTVQFYLNTAYMCGGIGSDEAAVFRSARANYPLSLSFGQNYGNKVAFIADVQVVIRDAYDITVLNINSDGPFCLLDIDPDTYNVYATYEGQTIHQSIDVTQQGHQLSFVWPEHIAASGPSPITTSTN